MEGDELVDTVYLKQNVNNMNDMPDVFRYNGTTDALGYASWLAKCDFSDANGKHYSWVLSSDGYGPYLTWISKTLGIDGEKTSASSYYAALKLAYGAEYKFTVTWADGNSTFDVTDTSYRFKGTNAIPNAIKGSTEGADPYPYGFSDAIPLGVYQWDAKLTPTKDGSTFYRVLLVNGSASNIMYLNTDGNNGGYFYRYDGSNTKPSGDQNLGPNVNLTNFDAGTGAPGNNGRVKAAVGDMVDGKEKTGFAGYYVSDSDGNKVMLTNENGVRIASPQWSNAETAGWSQPAAHTFNSRILNLLPVYNCTVSYNLNGGSAPEDAGSAYNDVTKDFYANVKGVTFTASDVEPTREDDTFVCWQLIVNNEVKGTCKAGGKVTVPYADMNKNVTFVAVWDSGYEYNLTYNTD